MPAVPPPLPVALRAQLFTQLAAMEKAGLPPERAFGLIDLPPPAHARVLSMRRQLAAHADIARGGLRAGLFTPLESALLAAATTAGTLARGYRRLADQYTTRARQQSQIRSRCVLPVVLLVLASFIQPVPALFAGGITPAAYLWQATRPLLQIAALVAALAWAWSWFLAGAMTPARTTVARLVWHLPVLGRLYLRRHASRFFEHLAILLEAGLPMLDALPVALATVGDHLLRQSLATIRPAVLAGAPLAEAIPTVPAVPTAVLVELIRTGEASGTLPEMLLRFTAAEGAELDRQQQALTEWLPRLFYFLVLASFAYHLIGSRPTGLPAEISLQGDDSPSCSGQWRQRVGEDDAGRLRQANAVRCSSFKLE